MVSRELTLLRLHVLLELSDMLLLSLGVKRLLLDLLQPFLLFLSKAVHLLNHFLLLFCGVVPVVGLQLRDSVHGTLATVTLLLNVGEQLSFVHLRELRLDLLI